MSYKYPPESKPLPGYTIKRGIGRGAFGEVYYAVSNGGKEVALKLVQNHVEVELRGVRECLNLDHPNLVRLYDVQQTEQGESWVVMEYCDGESLEEAVARHPNGMPVDLALQWMRGICAGVAYLHSRDVVHRDLKPSHIFLENGLVKLGDYGLAKFLTVSRRSGHTEGIGTVYYAAPEMAEGRYGKEIDLYALGVMFYEMLSGDVPFDGQTPAEVLMKHLTAPPKVSRFPSPYREIIRRLLEKDPRRRYRSVPELVAALNLPVTSQQPKDETWLQSQLRSVKRFVSPKRALGRTWYFVRNNRAATVVITLLLLVAFGIGAAVMENSIRRYRGYRYGYYVGPRSIDIRDLSDVLVKRNDGSGTTVRLGDVASFNRPQNQHFLSPSRPVYEIVISPQQLAAARVDRNAVMEAAWDAGYSLVIEYELRDGPARDRGIDIARIRRQIDEMCGRKEVRRRQCNVVTDGRRLAIRFRRDRTRRNPQRGAEYFVLNPQEFFDVEINGNKGSAKIAELATIHLHASSPF